MGWEKRPGGRYYYRKVRRGKRVVSEYMGAGELASAIAQLDVLERQQRELGREQWREQRDGAGKLDRTLDEKQRDIQHLLCGLLVAHGYHTHKGQWRRRRRGRAKRSG